MILALVGALGVGICLGLLGSGGSILTVPVLVYVLHRPEKVAIAEGLAIVGGIALIGAAQHARRGKVSARAVLAFGLPGMAGAFAGSLLSKHIPGAAQLTLFALVMLAASWAMLRPKKQSPQLEEGRPHTLRLVAAGLGVGALTGVVGVGGGFLIVPALVLLGGLPMHRAVGSSLAIIFLNCLSGFVKHTGVIRDLGMTLDWQVIGLFVAVGAAGSIAGSALASRLNQRVLRRIFGVFLVLMGLFILAREAPEALRPERVQPDAPSAV